MADLINAESAQRELVINTDGGSRGNPGPAAIGVVISTPDGNHLESFGEYIGETTNNQAEYLAVVRAIEEATKYRPTRIRFLLDSELVVKQLNGQYKVKNADLMPLYSKIVQYIHNQEVTFKHVPRAQNTLADIEVNKALDNHPAA